MHDIDELSGQTRHPKNEKSASHISESINDANAKTRHPKNETSDSRINAPRIESTDMSKTEECKGRKILARLQELIVGRLSELNPDNPEDVHIHEACDMLYHHIESVLNALPIDETKE